MRIQFLVMNLDYLGFGIKFWLLIIVGIVIGCISVPLKIIGRNAIKGSIEMYNQNPYTLSKNKDFNLVLFAKNNSVGLSFKF